MNTPNLLTMSEYIAHVQAERLRPSEVWKACSSQIERLNPVLNAFITRLDQVSPFGSDDSQESGFTETPLAGAPIAVKDLFETEGIRTTAGSLFFKDHIPETDAVAVAKVRTAGGVIIGKTNTHEIALGVTTVNPHFGACRNPWDKDRVPGGSSGGSAVAVSTGMAIAALGTDTGGSIRIPASLCGVVGLKPTYGRVSLRGVIPLSWNLDHVGPLTRSIADAALMLEILAGPDAGDPTSVDAPMVRPGEHLEDGVRGWRVLLATGAYVEDCDPEVLAAVDAAAGLFERMGAILERRDLSFLGEAALANGLMTQADGATYHRQRLLAQPELFGADVRLRLETGRDVKAADYVLARRTQTEMRHRLLQLLGDCDVILLPSTPITAPPIEGGDAVQHARKLTRFTAPFNLTGLPAISVPCGFDQTGMPIGLQLVCGAWQEARLLQAARAYERETIWGSRRPPILQ
jgi:aspartyl-tRNA(Asn)/glutamyl-tRNA(Gln) amidotransferase subunit A